MQDVLKRLDSIKKKLQTGPRLDMNGNLIYPKGFRSSSGLVGEDLAVVRQEELTVTLSQEYRDFYT